MLYLTFNNWIGLGPDLPKWRSNGGLWHMVQVQKPHYLHHSWTPPYYWTVQSVAPLHHLLPFESSESPPVDPFCIWYSAIFFSHPHACAIEHLHRIVLIWGVESQPLMIIDYSDKVTGTFTLGSIISISPTRRGKRWINCYMLSLKKEEVQHKLLPYITSLTYIWLYPCSNENREQAHTQMKNPGVSQ